MSEWTETTLGDLIDIKHGWAFKGEFFNETNQPKNVVVAIGNFDYSGGFRFDSTRIKEYLDSYPKEYELTPGDILLAMTCQTAGGEILGIPGRIPRDSRTYLHNQRLGKVEIKDSEGTDSSFIYWLCLWRDFNHHLVATATGTKILHTAPERIKSFIFKCPPIHEQRQIGKILDVLDRKIENLRRQNETLERIAQTLFKHWFVDFEFPNEDGKPYKASGGAMERSELGKIPAGWRVGKLGDFCNIKHGYAFKGEFITTEETEQILLTPGNFKICGGFNSSKYKYYSDYDYDEEYILAPSDLIVTMTDLSKDGDTLGYPAFVPKNCKNLFLHNQRLGKVVDSQIDLFFLFFLLCRREYRSHILGTASGSTVRHTSPSRILEYKFTVPNRKLLDQFSLITSNLNGKIFSHDEQIKTLAKSRDALLPKLMSGQLRII